MPELWTPGGVVHTEKDVHELERQEMAVLANLHDFTSKYTVVLLCPRCDSAIVGLNADSDREFHIGCKCREWRYRRRT